MSVVVIDTNVIAVANWLHDTASITCIETCVAALVKARSKVVAVDSMQECFTEYFTYASRSGQPGVGDAFVKWLWDNQGYEKHCELVDITPVPDDPGNYEEYPDDPDLAGFDRSDKKFVAVAIASTQNHEIWNATDKHWWQYRVPFQRNGINLIFLCPCAMPTE